MFVAEPVPAEADMIGACDGASVLLAAQLPTLKP